MTIFYQHQIMEKLVRQDNLNLEQINLKEMDLYWKKAKDLYISNKEKG